MNSTTRCLCVALILIGSPSRSEAAKVWLQIDSPHFTVISNDTEHGARNVVWQFEQVRAVVQTLWPWARIATDRPVTIFAAPDEDTMKMLAPQYWEQNGIHPSSIFTSGLDRYYIALRSDVRLDGQGDVNPYFDAYRSYLSLVISSSVRAPLPLWYSIGMAAVFGNTIVRNDEVQLGRPFQPYLRELRSHERLRLRELIVADTKSKWYTDPARRYTLDAESWLLVHFLLFGSSDRADSNKLSQYVNALVKGTPSATAFENTFGPPDILDDAFMKYMQRPVLTYLRAKTDLTVKPDNLLAHVLSPPDAASARASWHIAVRRLTEAGAELDEARKLNANSAAVSDVEGLFFEATQQYDRATAAFNAAVTAGSTSYYSYYRLANSPMPPAASPLLNRKEELLERSIALNDLYFPVYSTLSAVKAQLGKNAEALSVAERAAALAPTEFAADTLLATAFSVNRRDAEAIAKARDAVVVANTDQEKRFAEELLQRMAAGAVSRLPPLRPPVPVPDGAVRIGGSTALPRKTKDVPPMYPELAKAGNFQGIVILELTVGTDGHVIQARALRAVPFLDRSAIDAAEKWEDEPTTINGRTVPVIMTVSVVFALQ